MTCPNCREEISDNERDCSICHHDCGYPNVRAAQKPEEQTARAGRLDLAEQSASARGCAPLMAEFRTAVRSSRAVLCRSLSQVQSLVSGDHELYASFYQLVAAGARRRQNTPEDRDRGVADELLFPGYREHIRFAALSLDGRGVPHYGECSLVLKDSVIRQRATVFEENSLYFCGRLGLGVRRPVPPGYRATWDERDGLAAAKLEPKLRVGMRAPDFAGILLALRPPGGEPDFVEVHIYGPLHRKSIERLVIRQPRRAAHRAILKQLTKVLREEVGATIETY